VQGLLTVSVIGVDASVGERSQRAALNQVTLREVGFDRPGLEVAWHDGDGAWAVHVLDPIAAERLLTSSPLSTIAAAATVKAGRRRTTTTRSIAVSVLAAVLLVLVALLVWLVLNAGSIAAWVTDHVPVDQEIAVGRQAFAGMRAGLELKDEGPAYDAVQSIVATLTTGSKYRYEVHVAKDDTPNAFAMPGGVIVVHTGLIAATTRPEELAGVLAHEVQHVELRHSLRGLITELGLGGLWSFVTGDLGSTMAGQATLELARLRFSREDEREADARGFDALVAAGIDPAGMPAFFKIMSQKSADVPLAFLSTHPLSDDRERELQQRLEALNRDRFLPLPAPRWPP
jgi:predicted Zn-dependent protease